MALKLLHVSGKGPTASVDTLLRVKGWGPWANRLLDRRMLHTSKLSMYPVSGTEGLPPWPETRNPSPYDIFGLEGGKAVDQKKIRGLYLKLAKLYHPDSVTTLAPDTKSERFKKLMAAYEILKDENKRRTYDFDSSRAATTAAASSSSGAPRGAYSGFHHSATQDNAYSSHFYNRGPYEGYEYDAMRNMEDEDLQRHLNENRMRLVFLVALATLFYGAAQVYRIMQKSAEQSEVAELETLAAHLNVLRARANYGSGTSQEDRIQRFLRNREEAMYYNQHSKGQGSASDEGSSDLLELSQE